MANRVGYVGTESIGDVVTKTNFDKLPGGLVGYGSITADSSAVTGTQTISGLSLSFTAGTSRRYLIIIACSNVQLVGTGNANINIFDVTGAVQLAARSVVANGSNAGAGGAFPGATLSVFHDPTAGSQNYAFRTTTTMTSMGVNASATAPAQILVFDTGPTF